MHDERKQLQAGESGRETASKENWGASIAAKSELLSDASRGKCLCAMSWSSTGEKEGPTAAVIALGGTTLHLFVNASTTSSTSANASNAYPAYNSAR